MSADLSSPEALRTWQGVARGAFIRKLGARRLGGAPPVRIRGQHRVGNIIRTTIEYEVDINLKTSAHVYRMSGGPSPAAGVLLLHGHHNDGKDSAAVLSPKLGYGQFRGALDLARQGYVVLTPDVRSFGESGNRKDHERFVLIMQLAGRTAMASFVEDAWRALDVLEQVDGVDPNRLAVAGLSLGAQLAIYTAATDDRIKAAVVQGYLASHRGTHINRWHCVCQYLPGMAGFMDISDVALLAAPKPMLFVSGKKDREFPLREARRAFDKIRAGYRRLTAENQVELHVHPGAHVWRVEPAIEFLRAHLPPN